MYLKQDLKKFMMDFFKTSGFEIIKSDKIYTVKIPKSSQNFFECEMTTFTFDKNTSMNTTCELIVPGSKLLHRVILMCNSKGPIKKWTLKNRNGNWIIRFHFFINLKGKKSFQSITFIDIDTATMESKPIVNEFYENDFLIPDDVCQKITNSYLVALEYIQREFKNQIESIKKERDDVFNQDYGLSVKRFDDEMSELDESINKKQNDSHDANMMGVYTYETIKKIEEVEKMKNSVLRTLLKKHELVLEYNLIAAEVFQA